MQIQISHVLYSSTEKLEFLTLNKNLSILHKTSLKRKLLTKVVSSISDKVIDLLTLLAIFHDNKTCDTLKCNRSTVLERLSTVKISLIYKNRDVRNAKLSRERQTERAWEKGERKKMRLRNYSSHERNGRLSEWMEIALGAREYLERRSIYLDICDKHKLVSYRCWLVIVEHNTRDRVCICVCKCMNLELCTANFFCALAANLEAKSLIPNSDEFPVPPNFLSYKIIFFTVQQLNLIWPNVSRISHIFTLNSSTRQYVIFIKFWKDIEKEVKTWNSTMLLFKL